MLFSSLPAALLLLFLQPTSVTKLYTTKQPPSQSRGLNLSACAEFSFNSRGGDITVMVDRQHQRFALSHLRTPSEAHGMARYFVRQFFLDQYDPHAVEKLTQELLQRSSVLLPPHRSLSSISATNGCVVPRDQPLTKEKDKDKEKEKEKKRRLTLIYQMNFTDSNNHREFLYEILSDGGDIVVEEVWDGTFSVLADHAIIVYHTESCENTNMPLLTYLQSFDRLHFAYGVVHLHDERIDGCRSHYPMSRFVLRNNYHPSFFDRQHILEIPIGYSNGAARKINKRLLPPRDRRYLWSFMGDVASKPDRKNTLKRMHEIEMYENRSIFVHELHHWNDGQKMSVEEYREILSRSIFAPSPIGTVYENGNLPNGLGAMRTWESLEQGALPIIQSFETLDPLWREHTDWLYVGRYQKETIPLLVVRDDWANVKEILKPYLENKEMLDELWSRTMEWYKRTKMFTRKAVKKFVLDRLYVSRQWWTANEFGFCTVLVDNQYLTMKCTPE